MIRSSGPPREMILDSLTDVPEGKKCRSCLGEFTDKMAKTRHFSDKNGNPKCIRVPVTTGRPKKEKISKKPAISPNADANSKVVMPGPSYNKWPPGPKYEPRNGDCVPSKLVRVPWGDKPLYMSRETLRAEAIVEHWYEWCLSLEFCDPLKLYEYYVSKRVFKATNGLPEDEKSRRKAFKMACKVLEGYYGIPRNTIGMRRSTKRESKRLPLTCPTPDWMEKWLRKEPELYDDSLQNLLAKEKTV